MSAVHTSFVAYRMAEQLESRARDLYMVGFEAGHKDASYSIERKVDNALGIGVVIGFCIGVAVTIGCIGWLT